MRVLAEIEVMTGAIEVVKGGAPISNNTHVNVQRRLLPGPRLEDWGHLIRNKHKRNGDNDYSPRLVAFVPPPEEELPGLLEDLLAFCTRESLSKLAHAPIAHAEFETEYPFSDGNGTTGRSLFHLLLRRGGIPPHFLLPVSLVLANRVNKYVAGLTAGRYFGRKGSDIACEGINRWTMLFAGAARMAVQDARRFEVQGQQLQASWLERVGNPKPDTTIRELIGELPAAPVLTTTTASELTGRTFQAANLAISRLVDAGILEQVNVGRRNRAFEAPELIDAFTWLERQLQSPAAATRISRTVGRVPECS